MNSATKPKILAVLARLRSPASTNAASENASASEPGSKKAVCEATEPSRAEAACQYSTIPGRSLPGVEQLLKAQETKLQEQAEAHQQLALKLSKMEASEGEAQEALEQARERGRDPERSRRRVAQLTEEETEGCNHSKTKKTNSQRATDKTTSECDTTTRIYDLIESEVKAQKRW